MSCKNLIIFCTNPVYVMGRSSSVHQSFASLSKFSFPFNCAPRILNSSRSLLLYIYIYIYIYACVVVSSIAAGRVYLGNEEKCRINGIEFVEMVHDFFNLQFHPCHLKNLKYASFVGHWDKISSDGNWTNIQQKKSYLTL